MQFPYLTYTCIHFQRENIAVLTLVSSEKRNTAVHFYKPDYHLNTKEPGITSFKFV
jgi:hypothetical protein